ncbi:fatty acid and retinol binding protein [Aphelenchoides avenae]|nr:fatty acid and retinol binding protein [Aphelenchus avenae]
MSGPTLLILSTAASLATCQLIPGNLGAGIDGIIQGATGGSGLEGLIKGALGGPLGELLKGGDIGKLADAVKQNQSSVTGFIPDSFKAKLPVALQQSLDRLEESDIDAAKQVLAEHSIYQTFDQFMQALKAKSPQVYDVAQQVQTAVGSKLQQLNTEAGPEGEAFIGKAVDSARKAAKKAVEQYQKMSPQTKTALHEKLPWAYAALGGEWDDC